MIYLQCKAIINKIVKKKGVVMFIFYTIYLCIYLDSRFGLHTEIYIYKLNFFLGPISGNRITGS